MKFRIFFDKIDKVKSGLYVQSFVRLTNARNMKILMKYVIIVTNKKCYTNPFKRFQAVRAIEQMDGHTPLLIISYSLS